MSTKIYNGYQIKKMNLQKLTEFIDIVRKDMKEILEDYYGDFFVSRMVYGFDKVHNYSITYKELFNENFHTDSDLKNAYGYAYEHCEYCKNHLDHLFSFKGSIQIIPIKNKILALTYLGNKKLQTKWDSYPQISEYCYFNNTDRPEKISERQWNIRRKDWDIALGNDIPKHRGFSIEFEHENMIHRDNIEQYLVRHTDESRRKILANNEIPKNTPDRDNIILKTMEKYNIIPLTIENIFKTIDK